MKAGLARAAAAAGLAPRSRRGLLAAAPTRGLRRALGSRATSTAAAATSAAAGVPAAAAAHGHCGLVLGAKAKAHPRKAEKHDHGEDAFFVSESDAAFGVADGVSQWADYNIDAGEYSRKLMELCAEEVADIMSAEDARFADPKRALEKAYRRSLSVMGSSTACVLTMDGEGTLRAANLGDSGFIVLRPGFTRPNASQQEAIKKKRRAREIQWDVIYRSQEMQKYFNCPDQLGPGCPDKPSRAETYELPLETGDIILAATDGVFDNISDANLCVLVKRFSLELQSLLPTDQGAFSAASVKHDAKLRPWLHSVADRICQEAHLVGMNTTGITPFSEQCRNAGYLFEGGKLDDVTVVAAMVVSKE